MWNPFRRKPTPPAVAPTALPEGASGPVVPVRSVGIAKRNSHSFTGPTVEQAMIIAVQEANKAGIGTDNPRIRDWMNEAREHLKLQRRAAQATGQPAILVIGTRSFPIEFRP